MAAVLVVVNWAMPPEVEAQQSRSLDEQLLEDLGGDPLDELDRELFGPSDKQGKAADPTGKRPGDLSGRLRQELGPAADAEENNPLLQLARRMREVEGLIAKNDSGRTTTHLQRQIVADLDELIEQARKRCSQCKPGDKPPGQASSRQPVNQPASKPGSGGNTAGQNPATDSNAKPGQATARQPDAQRAMDFIKQLWGQLPQRDRERMTQSPPEEFLPKYELMIEDYYRRLSEEKLP